MLEISDSATILLCNPLGWGPCFDELVPLPLANKQTTEILNDADF